MMRVAIGSSLMRRAAAAGGSGGIGAATPPPPPPLRVSSPSTLLGCRRALFGSTGVVGRTTTPFLLRTAIGSYSPASLGAVRSAAARSFQNRSSSLMKMPGRPPVAHPQHDGSTLIGGLANASSAPATVPLLRAATRRALVTASRQARNHRHGGFAKSPDGYSCFMWRPAGAGLAQACYSSSPMGGGGGRGGGNRWAAGGIGLVGAASVLLGKSKYVLGALKLTKLASLGSMVLTVGTYSMFFGLPYAAGMVGLILVHETGHALVMRRRGVDFSPMVFVPFVGAFIAMRDRPRDAYEDALIALGGPVMGGAGAGAVALAASATQSQLLFALADFGFMINLFNLLPIGAMDGGRIASALSPYAGVAGLGLGGVLAYSGAVHNPIFYLILLAGGWETFQRFYNPASTPPNYYRITPLQRATLTTSYFGLVAALLAGMAWNHRYQKPPEVLMRERQRELSWDMR